MKFQISMEEKTATERYLKICLDRARKYIGSPIVALSLLTHHPIPFRAYFERLVGRELDLGRLVIVAGYVLQESPTFGQLLFRLLQWRKKKKLNLN